LRCFGLTAALAAVVGAVLLAASAPLDPATAQPVRGPSLAQLGGGTVADIRIEGAQRIEPETIR